MRNVCSEIKLPLISTKIRECLAKQLLSNARHCEMQFGIRLQELRMNSREARASEDVFSSLIGLCELWAVDESAVVSQFRSVIACLQEHITLSNILFILSTFEEFAVAVVRRNMDESDIAIALQWVHALILQLSLAAVAQLTSVTPTGRFATMTSMEQTTLTAMLNYMGVMGIWDWAAIVTSHLKKLSIVDVAVWNKDEQVWYPANMDTQITEQVYERCISGRHTFKIPVAGNLTFIVSGEMNAQSELLLNQCVRWLNITLQLAKHMNDDGGYSELCLQRALLHLDETILTAKQHDRFSHAMRELCQFTGFSRSALLAYAPVTKTFEGFEAYNIPVQDIRRVKEMEWSVPEISHTLQTLEPYHITDAHGMIPDHHVKFFGLTSLLVVPFVNPDKYPLGLVLLDHQGSPFTPDGRTVQAAQTIINRMAKVSTMLADEAHNLSKAGESSSGISNNELRILQLIANGLDTKDIARTLYLSEYTVNDYVKSILRKFGAKNRSHAVAVALRKGLIQ